MIDAEFDAKYNKIKIPEANIEFDVKFGKNKIKIPVTINNGVMYADSGKGLSNLYGETFTIINRIPTSPNNASIRAYKRFYIIGCDRKDGIFDRQTNTMIYKANSWTAMSKDIAHYKHPNWIDGYYTLPDDIKSNYYTVNAGDLIIFQKIEDNAPTNIQEFNTLKSKYNNVGGIITNTTPYINYHANGQAWRTNHIEMIKG